jgi:hypothetical protein
LNLFPSSAKTTFLVPGPGICRDGGRGGGRGANCCGYCSGGHLLEKK